MQALCFTRSRTLHAAQEEDARAGHAVLIQVIQALQHAMLKILNFPRIFDEKYTWPLSQKQQVHFIVIVSRVVCYWAILNQFM